MKTKIYLFALFLISILNFSCSSDDNLNYKDDFENSQTAWLNFKESSNNSYKYIVSGGSVLADYGWETTITISNGVIIRRDFKYIGNLQNIPADELEWTENESEINTHETSNAKVALTLDDVYNKAKNEWLVKRKNTTNYFESKNNGLISTCGYTANGCMDDCFIGITIKSISKQ
jgi:hypothetical protein